MIIQIQIVMSVLALTPMAGCPEQPKLPSEEYLHLLLRRIDDNKRKILLAYGERLFPTYEKILTDEQSPGPSVSGVLKILSHSKGDRSRFVDLAVAKLTTNVQWRNDALFLLGRIGSEREASPIVALMSDPFSTYLAAEAIAAIGGPRELVAFDVWLATNPLRKREDLRKHVAKFRDDLKQRLEKAKKPGK